MNNSNAKIGKSKFADLRPKHACLRSETPANICICIYYNLFQAFQIQRLSLWKKVVCNDEDEKRMFQMGCGSCGDLQMYDDLVDSLTLADVEEIRYK